MRFISVAVWASFVVGMRAKRKEIPLVALMNVFSVSTLGTLPKLTISPVLKSLGGVFPSTASLRVRVLSSLPSLLVVPFVLLSNGLARGIGGLLLLRVKLTLFKTDNVLCLLSSGV